MAKQRIEGTSVTLLYAAGLRIIKKRQQAIDPGREAHHDHSLADCHCVLVGLQRNNGNVGGKVFDVEQTNCQVVAASGHFELQWDRLGVIREIGVKLFESRLTPHGSTQTLGALVCKPRLGDMAVGNDKTVAHIKTTSGELKLGYGRIAIRCQCTRFTTILDCRTALSRLRLGISQWTARPCLYKIISSRYQAHSTTEITAQLYRQ